ncbi:MAG: putative manganese-dependent inorganic diphosphatase [Bacilli bacterium]|nr:putative manganese-dependent inorganic diphosphatase [Bacilli bacterium]
METFIFGHKKPDTDSVMAAISLSYLENACGNQTTPKLLGSVNKETRYALEQFHLDEPDYLNDVKLQLKDIKYHKDFYLKETDSIFDGYQYMLDEGLTGLPIVKANNDFIGLITIKDLSRTMVYENGISLDTSYDNILDTISGEEIIRVNKEIKGKILAAAFKDETFMENINLSNEDILIVGDRHSIIEYAIKSQVKLLIITGDGEIQKSHIELAKENKVNIIRTKYDTYHVSRVISLSNYIKTMIRSYNPAKFLDTDYVDDVVDINNKLKHTNYPIVDKNNKCLGLLKITDLSEKKPKKVILVDHNEKKQSADGIDEAEIIEIIDHHNLGSITTNMPVNFRNMAVGSSCTIIYTLYQEKNIKIPKEIAGAMLSGIVSDTLILKSPTATKKDREAVEELSKIAGVDYKEYGMNLLKAGTSLEGMSREDVLYNDFKLYTVEDNTFGVGQFFTMNFSDIEKELDEYVHVLDEVSEANNYDFLALYVTDIIKNGSYILYNTKAQDKVEIMYNNHDVYQGYFIEGCVSRKKNVIPLIMEIYEN